ncbi:hypothetical protein [Ensifer sp. ENS05]|jgi:hypothetical protein|nr:hypothetical protein [Ensifer sp. ENS05]MBD9598135.1 hypothetical protein [Ensifer sp. ENS05]
MTEFGCYLPPLAASFFSSTGDAPMAKGQVRSNKEARKPKKDKDKAAAKPAAPTFGSQVKDTNKK